MNLTCSTELLFEKTFSFHVLITNVSIIITDCTSHNRLFQSMLFKPFEALKASTDIQP